MFNHYYQKILFCKDFDSQKQTIEDYIKTGTFEQHQALIDYFHNCHHLEGKLFLIKKCVEIPQLRQQFRLLVEFSYTQNFTLKLEVIKSIGKICHPLFSHRLVSIFKNTDNDEKKVIIIKTLIKYGISLYLPEILERFSKESRRIQNYLLSYYSNIPFLEKEICQVLIHHINDLLNNCEDDIEENKLYHHLWLLQTNHPEEYRKSLRLLKKSNFSYSLYSHLLYTKPLNKPINESKKEIIQSLHQKDNIVIHKVRYDFEKIEKLIPILDQELEDIHSHFESTDNIFIWNLIKLNHIKVVELMIKHIEKSQKAFFQQSLLNSLSFFNFTPEQKSNLKKSLFTLFSTSPFNKVFPVLTRNILLLFKEQGLKEIIDTFCELTDIEKKTGILNGLYHTILDFGYGKNLRHFDVYSINLLLDHSLRFAIKNKVQKPHYLDLVFTLIYFFDLKTHIDEMVSLCRTSQRTAAMTRSIVNINTELSMNYTIQYLEKHLDEKEDPAPYLAIFQHLNNTKAQHAGIISDELLIKYLKLPIFSASIIHFCFKYNKTSLFPHIQKISYSSAFSINLARLPLLEYLDKQNNKDILKENLKELWEKNDLAIRSHLLPTILKNYELDELIKIYGEIFKQKDGFNQLIEIIEKEKMDDNQALRNFKAIQSYVKEYKFKYIEQLVQAIFQAKGNYFARQIKNNELTLPNQKIETNIAYSFETIVKNFNQKIKGYISNKMDLVYQDESFQKEMSRVFYELENLKKFISIQRLYSKIKIDETCLAECYQFLTKEKNELLNDIDIKIFLHILMIVGHQSEFHSIQNPMKLNLEYYQKKEIPSKIENIARFIQAYEEGNKKNYTDDILEFKGREIITLIDELEQIFA